MSFDFDAYSGVLTRLIKELNNTATKTGIPLAALCEALQRCASRRGDKREAIFWKNASSDEKLGTWMYLQSGRAFDSEDEVEYLAFAKDIPFRVRRGLIEVVKQLPSPRGGKPRALDTFTGWEVRHLVRLRRDNGESKERAYKFVARQMKVSPHTIRRECEPEERLRSRRRANERIVSLRSETG